MREVKFKGSVITEVVTYLISYLSIFTLTYIKIESRFLLRITVIPIMPFFFLLRNLKQFKHITFLLTVSREKTKDSYHHRKTMFLVRVLNQINLENHPEKISGSATCHGI